MAISEIPLRPKKSPTLLSRGLAALSSFRELLSDARRELARLSLQHPSLGLSKTASMLGYEDHNSFLLASRMGDCATPNDWTAIAKAGRSKRPPQCERRADTKPYFPPEF